MEKLPERPDPGLFKVVRGNFVIGDKIDQMLVGYCSNRPNFKNFLERLRIRSSGGLKPGENVRKTRQAMVNPPWVVLETEFNRVNRQ